MTLKLVLFTDLDGTLLDERYGFDAARPALALIARLDTPLVICSSKTRPEIELYRKRLDNHHPFISENGGGIFVPRGYFGGDVTIPDCEKTRDGRYETVRLGARYGDLRRAVEALRSQGHGIRGFGDMAAEEVARLTGLAVKEAAMAKERGFDEPFVFHGGAGEVDTLIEAAQRLGLSVTKGRIYHLLGHSDKGKAVAILTDLYKQKHGTVVTVGLGDSPNDLSMLRAVHIPVVVQRPDGTYNPTLLVPGVAKARGIGPEGWNSAVMELMSAYRACGPAKNC